MCNVSLQNYIDTYIYGTIAYSEGHNGGRTGPVDRVDSLVKTSVSNNIPLRGLGMSPGRFVLLCRHLPLGESVI